MTATTTVRERTTKSAKTPNGSPAKEDSDAITLNPGGKPMKPGAITAPKFAILSVRIKNQEGSPLVIHAFSSPNREKMRATQEAGAQSTKRKGREPKDFENAWNLARYVSTAGWDGFNSTALRNAMISSCRLVGFKMTLTRMSIFVEPDGSTIDGVPLVRINGTPAPVDQSIHPVRNATGVMDLRARPMWHTWHSDVRIKFDRDLFSEIDVINLLIRAGAQNGIGEGRANSKMGNGVGWGAFEVDPTVQPGLQVLQEQTIEFVHGPRG